MRASSGSCIATPDAVKSDQNLEKQELHVREMKRIVHFRAKNAHFQATPRCMTDAHGAEVKRETSFARIHPRNMATASVTEAQAGYAFRRAGSRAGRALC